MDDGFVERSQVALLCKGCNKSKIKCSGKQIKGFILLVSFRVFAFGRCHSHLSFLVRSPSVVIGCPSDQQCHHCSKLQIHCL